MAADVWPVTDDFAAEIGDVDLGRPLSDGDWETIEAAYLRYAVLIFPDQHLAQDDHVRFARRFGEIDVSMVVAMDTEPSRIPPEIADVSNLDGAGAVRSEHDRMLEFQRANRLWHTDSSFKETPANASCLYMRSIPPVGGQTEFADMRAAWDALPDDVRDAIEGRIAIHSIATSRSRLGFDMTPEENERHPRVPQALVRHHPATGRTSIYVASHAGSVVGMDDDEGRRLIDRLIDHGTQRQFVHSHRWRADDLVIWDNRCVLHRGRPFDDLRWARDAQRATSRDVGPTWRQEGIELPEDRVSAGRA